MESCPESNNECTSRRQALARLSALWAGMALPLVGCGGGGGADSASASTSPPPPAPSPSVPPPPPPPPGPPPSGPARVTVLNDTLASPWGMAFLPDGRMLITQKGGTMVIVSANGQTVSSPLAGVPSVLAEGQGGLLDVALDPDFATTPWVYFSYSEAGPGGSGTAVNRGRLVGNQLLDVPATPIFRQLPKFTGTAHYGSRLAFRADKTLFITLGERQLGEPAQDLGSHLGKVVRINRDGSVPSDNPFVGTAGARPEIWSYGHRNPQGAAIHPTTGELWLTEHGAQGGDELNIARAGGNYGWPLKSYGCNYGVTTPNCQIGGGGGVHAPTYVEPVSRWPAPSVPVPAPSVAPAGMSFYTGSGFPEWQGSVFVGTLVGRSLWRIVLNGNAEVARERVFNDVELWERIRCVRQGPDGWLYLLTDSGKLIRVER